MRALIASAALGAVFALLPAASGHAPAWSADFSITNPEAPADGSRADVMRQLQAWWDVHGYYPRHASLNDEGGTVGVHLTIRSDGRIRSVAVVRGSGSQSLDAAALRTFTGGFIRPFPEGMPGTELDISLNYVLAHRHDQPIPVNYKPVPPKTPFTIANDPVKPPLLEKMLQKTCTGTIVLGAVLNHPLYGVRFYRSSLVFFRQPDGTPWVQFHEGGHLSISPVVEVGKLVSWRGPESSGPHGGGGKVHYYTAWLEGSNKLKGTISSSVGGNTNYGTGTIDFSCAEEVVPQIEWNAWYVPRWEPPFGDPP
jgi:TonB family protein